MAQATTIDQNEQQHEDSDSTHAESFNAASNGTVVWGFFADKISNVNTSMFC